MAEVGQLGLGRDALVTLSAAIGTRNRIAIEEALRRVEGLASRTEVDEVLLQSHLFVGFPDALNALTLWRELNPVSPPLPAEEDPDLWEVRGVDVCATVYASNYSKLRANVAALHPDLDQWMVVGGYGRVLGRPGLPLATRELCIVALLAAWGAPRQLHSHLRGALNAGASAAEVERTVEIACGYISESAADEVRELWTRVRENWGNTERSKRNRGVSNLTSRRPIAEDR